MSKSIDRSGRVGRPRELTAQQFRAGVEAYFRAICYTEPVKRRVAVETVDENGIVHAEKDEMGHKVYREEPVTDMDGNPMMRLCYAKAPGIASLCLYIGINKSTFARYGEITEGNGITRREAELYRATALWARERIEAYLEPKLEEKNSRGVMFNLEHNHGWMRRSEVTVRGGVEEYLKSLPGGVEY